MIFYLDFLTDSIKGTGAFFGDKKDRILEFYGRFFHIRSPGRYNFNKMAMCFGDPQEN